MIWILLTDQHTIPPVVTNHLGDLLTSAYASKRGLRITKGPDKMLGGAYAAAVDDKGNDYTIYGTEPQ